MDSVFKRVILIVAIAVASVILLRAFKDNFYAMMYDKTDVYA